MLNWDSFNKKNSGLQQLVADVDPTLRLTEEPLNLRYELGEELGTGSFGRAVKAVRLEDDETVVIKQIRLLDLDERARQEALLEAKVLSAFDHVNIIKYYEAILEVGPGSRVYARMHGVVCSSTRSACMHIFLGAFGGGGGV